MKNIVLGLIRHGLTTGGGYLAAHGVIASSEVEGVVGAAVVIVGVIWSVAEKKFSGTSV